MPDKKILFLIGIFLISSVFAASDTAVFQGQYFKDNTFQEGTFNFTFNIYDAETGGNLVYSQEKIITTGFWGQWRAELTGISGVCDNVSKDYFMEVVINGNVQFPLRRLTQFNYLRKNANETTSGSISIGNETTISSGEITSSVIKPKLIKNDIPLIIQADKVGIGLLSGATPLAFLHVVQETNTTSNIGIMGDAYTYDTASGSGIILRKARGTQQNPQPIKAGDTIGYISTRGYGTTGFSLGGLGQGDIRILATEDWTDTSQGKNIQFKTTAKGNNFMEERLLIDENGINVTGNIYSSNKLVCLADGTNCQNISGNFADYYKKLEVYNKTEIDFFALSWTGGNSSFNQALTDSLYIAKINEAKLNVNSTTWWASLTGWIPGWFVKTGNNLDFNETKLNRAIDARQTGGIGSSMQYVSFISTVAGSLAQTSRYLPLGTDISIAIGPTESSWIIDRNLTITGILWDSASNTRTVTSAVTLFKSTSGKGGFAATSLSKNIQGQVRGSDLSYNVSFSQGNLAVIKYESGGAGGSITDLSVTLIGYYN